VTNDRRGTRRIWSALGLAVYCLIFSVIGFLGFELAVRVAAPEINTQGIERHLFRNGVFGTTRGLAANAIGSAFGALVHTDDHGFIALPGAPAQYQESWLILGDSVTFGLGVAAGSTFPGLLQTERPDVKIWNAAVPGYSALDYENVISALSKDLAFDRVLMFWCLNDVVAIPPPSVKREFSVQNKVRAFLKTYSKAYAWVKDVFFDLKQVHFEGDLAHYRKADNLARTASALKTIRDLLAKKSIPMTVFILPYEYQLRGLEGVSLLPQETIGQILTDLGLPFYDIQPYLLQHTVDSDALFLTADGLHFTKQGHKLIFDFIRRSLNSE